MNTFFRNTGPKAEEAEVPPPAPLTSFNPPRNANAQPLPTTTATSTDAAVPASTRATSTSTDAPPISQSTTAPSVP